jgi:hypothetical protein
MLQYKSRIIKQGLSTAERLWGDFGLILLELEKGKDFLVKMGLKTLQVAYLLWWHQVKHQDAWVSQAIEHQLIIIQKPQKVLSSPSISTENLLQLLDVNIPSLIIE